MDSVGFFDIYTCYYFPSFTYNGVEQGGSEYSGSFTRMQIGTPSESVCLDKVKDSNGPGSRIAVYVNPDNPTDIRSTQIEKNATAALMVCAPCGLLLLVGLFVYVRFNNVEPGAYVTRTGAIHHHRGYYPDNDVVVINNNYGSRHGYTDPMYYRHRNHRSHRTALLHWHSCSTYSLQCPPSDHRRLRLRAGPGPDATWSKFTRLGPIVKSN